MKSYKLFGNLAGGVLFLLIFFSLMGCASGAGARSLTVTDEMKSVISSYANDFAFEYPNELNVAHEVQIAPTALYFNDDLGWYAVTALIPQKQGVYGVVFMDEYEVFNVFSIEAASQGEVDDLLREVGYTR